MSADCLDCALYDCDGCARAIGEEYGCCCGRIQPTRDDDEDDEWEDDE